MNWNEIEDYIETHRSEYIIFLQKLIQTNSYNPPGHEQYIVDLIIEYLQDDPVTYTIFPFDDHRANLILSLNNIDQGREKVLLYNAHMDTVPVPSGEQWKYPPLSGHIIDNKFMMGRGTADMKSGLAAMVISMKILSQFKPTLSGTLIVNAVAEEETGGIYGTKWCVDHPLRDIHVDFAVVGECTELTPLSKAIMVGEKGQVQIKLTVYGQSAHSSMPLLVVNPIDIMSTIILNLHNLSHYIPEVELPFAKEDVQKDIMAHLGWKGSFEDLLEHDPCINALYSSITEITCCCTMCHAGVKKNMIPESCEASINIRLLPHHTVDMVLEALTHMIQDLGYSVHNNLHESIPSVSLEVEQYTEASYYEDWRKSELIQCFYGIVNEVYHTRPIYFIFPASADAEYLRNNNFCLHTILFGPGRVEEAHSKNESVDLEDFIKAIKVYTLFALHMLA